MPRNPSVRSLGQQLGLSATTISLALRDDPRVLPGTKARVVQAAARAGYQHNPIIHSVMSAMRRSAHGSFHGSLMAINYSATESPAMAHYHGEVLAGARTRAAELGFAMEHCWVGQKILTLKRLNSILRARNVQGIIVMPFAGTQDFSALNWPALSAVVMDYCLSNPALHTVLPDHHLSLFQAMEQLAAKGYKRAGLVLEGGRDARLKHKWSAGFTSSFRERQSEPPVPLLLNEKIRRDDFLNWFKLHQPDVIVGHLQREITGWLREINLAIPRDVGFLQLNWTERSGPCAGIDQQPALLGAAAIEAVVAQLTRNERGIPKNPKTITLVGRWIHGPTLRKNRSVKP